MASWAATRVYSPREWADATARTPRQFECSGIVSDPHAAAPEERLKALLYVKDASQEVNGFWLATSPDGLRWRRRADPVIPLEGDDSRLMWDPSRRRWLFTCRRHRMYADTRAGRPWKRTVSLAESEDCVHWTTLEPILKPADEDPADVQFYNMLIVPRAGLYLGFLSVYHLGEERTDLQLAVSRDLRHWERPGGRTPFLAPGPLGSWDDRSVQLAHSPPWIVGDRMRWWYTGSTTGHAAPYRRGAIGALEFGRDRFVGWVAGIRPGELVTEPLGSAPPGCWSTPRPGWATCAWSCSARWTARRRATRWRTAIRWSGATRPTPRSPGAGADSPATGSAERCGCGSG